MIRRTDDHCDREGAPPSSPASRLLQSSDGMNPAFRLSQWQSFFEFLEPSVNDLQLHRGAELRSLLEMDGQGWRLAWKSLIENKRYLYPLRSPDDLRGNQSLRTHQWHNLFLTTGLPCCYPWVKSLVRSITPDDATCCRVSDMLDLLLHLDNMRRERRGKL